MIKVLPGNSPLVLGMPHAGTDVPPAIWKNLNQTGRALADTDWHIHQLYDGLCADVTTVRTPIHRYVIDVNRDPDGNSLYPGANTTGLCPLTDFDGLAIYRNGKVPDETEVARRRRAYHAPYHTALETQLQRVNKLHGFAVLYDCHSIRSHVPFLFEGTLPDFNIGTNNGSTCDPKIEQMTADICQNADGYSSVLNGRFRGGWTTRHYGKPGQGLHVIQMELAQSTYMDEAAPWLYQASKAKALRSHLSQILTALKNWSPA
ncbi:MAG: N-formylglutamate deformylase [Rhodobacteraceae bacterium]|nr:N-formylglutamate deformylase [Paracoccaceae bacterium]